MALVKCPECTKEISDRVKACPHCGYPLVEEAKDSIPQQVEVTAVKFSLKNPARTKKIFLGITVVLIASIAIYVGLYINNVNKAKEVRNQYISNLELLSATTLLGGSDAESLCNLTVQVWRDTVYKDYNTETAKYTVQSSYFSTSKSSYSDYQFEDDFNTALLKLMIDDSTVAKTESIKSNQTLVESIMKDLKNPTQEFEKCYNTAEELYVAYQGLTDLAISPTGNLQSFTQSKSNKVDKFIEYYKRLKAQIPESDKK